MRIADLYRYRIKANFCLVKELPLGISDAMKGMFIEVDNLKVAECSQFKTVSFHVYLLIIKMERYKKKSFWHSQGSENMFTSTPHILNVRNVISVLTMWGIRNEKLPIGFDLKHFVSVIMFLEKRPAYVGLYNLLSFDPNNFLLGRKFNDSNAIGQLTM